MVTETIEVPEDVEVEITENNTEVVVEYEVPFSKLLLEEVFTSGVYNIEEHNGVAEVSEFKGGGGHIIQRDIDRLKDDERFELGMPTKINGGYTLDYDETIIVVDRR